MFSPNELARHLKSIIRAEQDMQKPSKPPFKAPARKVLPQLGEQSADARDLDVKFMSNVEDLESEARETIRDRESLGKGDIYSELQPPVMPDVADLLGERIDVLCSYDLENGSTDLRWCQGLVNEISDGSNMVQLGKRTKSKCYDANKAVMVLWDPIPELDMPEQETVQPLLPSKWNKQVVGSWRFDVGDVDHIDK